MPLSPTSLGRMRKFASFLILPSLLSLSACSTTSSVRTELQVATPHKQTPCAKASGKMATVGDIDRRRRTSERKLAECAAKVDSTNTEIDRLRKVNVK